MAVTGPQRACVPAAYAGWLRSFGRPRLILEPDLNALAAGVAFPDLSDGRREASLNASSPPGVQQTAGGEAISWMCGTGRPGRPCRFVGFIGFDSMMLNAQSGAI